MKSDVEDIEDKFVDFPCPTVNRNGFVAFRYNAKVILNVSDNCFSCRYRLLATCNASEILGKSIEIKAQCSICMFVYHIICNLKHTRMYNYIYLQLFNV